MSVPTEIWRYLIQDSSYRCYYVDNGVVKKMAIGGFSGSSFSPFLPQHPKGWKEIQISFGTNMSYWTLRRSVAIPLFFVGDGATICREAVWAGRGYEEELYLTILKLNPINGVHELEYRGRLDFSKHEDEPRKGISVNAIEGGLFSYMDANDSVQYEIKCDEDNSEALISFDGTNLFDKYRYSIVDFTRVSNSDETTFTLPFPFISNEGDSFGIISGSQQFDKIGTGGGYSEPEVAAYCTDSANYFFRSAFARQVRITGTIKIKYTQDNGWHSSLYLIFQTSAGQIFKIITDPLLINRYHNYAASENIEVPVDITINLVSEEKVFLIVSDSYSLASNTSKFDYILSDLYVSFVSKVPPTSAYAREPLNMLKELVSKMTDGKYTADSAFLAIHKNLVWTSTNALRQLTDETGAASGRVIQTSFKEFFNDLDCIYNMGVKVVNNVLLMEPKEDLYKDDTEIYDLGEIAGLKLKYSDDLLCNTATFGYKSQDYRQRNGRYEFNTTTVFKLPVNTLKKDYTKKLKARGDCFGIEFIRALLFDGPTKDTTGDNQPFIINVKRGQEDIDTTVSFVAAGQFMICENGIKISKGDIITIIGGLNAGTREVSDTGSFFLAQIITFVGGPAIVDETNVAVTLSFALSKSRVVNRAAYSSISGVLDDTVYNIEEMTPHRLQRAHRKYLNALLMQLPGDKITFLTADKNSDLSTTLSGVTIAERQDESIDPADILFIPRYAEFTTPVPITFAKVMANIGTGYVKGTLLGQPIYCLPIGKMDAKPAVNEAQTWRLLLAPKNDLLALKMLSSEGVFTTDTMGNSIFTSDLNPTHWVKYNYSLPLKYQHKEMYDDQFQNRTEDFISQPYYCQKWQKTETIPVQCIVRGLTGLALEVYDSNGILYETHPLNIIVDASVQLPYVRADYSLDISAYPEGIYFGVISSNSGLARLRISEYWDIRDKHEKTLLFEYSHTTNKFNTYFTGIDLHVRVEGTMLPWKPEGSFTEYTDEVADVELLDGILTPIRNLRLGNGYGIPDWMALKIARILFLNRCNIEGVRYSRTPSSKMTPKELPGHPMYSYLIEISKATNKYGLGTDESGSEEDVTILWTLDAQGFGISEDGAIVHIELPLEP